MHQFLQSPTSVEGEDNGDGLCETVTVRYSLRIMIINPSKKRDYVMVKADKSAAKVVGFNEMRELILSSFPCDVPRPDVDKLEFGYIEPGHGLKGKKEWILDDDDLKHFLGKYQSNNKELTLWCYSQGLSHCKRGSKRSRSKSPTAKSSKPGSSRYDAHIAKMAKVDEIYKEIHETHGNQYSPEQKRAWAHLIELGKHDSVTQPPKKRFFQSPPTSEYSPASSASAHPSTSTGTSSAATPICTPVITRTSSSPFVSSPGRRVSIGSECIDQLQKWHSLLKCGAITKEQYDELQSTIMSDIKLTSNVQ